MKRNCITFLLMLFLIKKVHSKNSILLTRYAFGWQFHEYSVYMVQAVQFFEKCDNLTLPPHPTLTLTARGLGTIVKASAIVFHHGEHGSLKTTNFTLTKTRQGKLNHSVIFLRQC